MHPGPSRVAEAIVGVFVPPACREEVLGDLYERFRSPLQYAVDALGTVPMVILSRIRRTADPQIVLMQAFVLSLSFLGAAYFGDRTLLRGQWGLFRLAVPVAIFMLGLILGDAYARPGRRPALNLDRGSLLGAALALGSEGVLRFGKASLAIPAYMAVYGCAMSYMLASTVRTLFPPAAGQLLGANVPTLWLKQADTTATRPGGIRRLFKLFMAVAGVAAGGVWLAELFAPPKSGIPLLAFYFLVVVLAWRRS